MKKSLALMLLATLTLAGCKAPPPSVTDDTLVTSEVNGVKLVHRHAVAAPAEFTPVNETWRAVRKDAEKGRWVVQLNEIYE